MAQPTLVVNDFEVVIRGDLPADINDYAWNRLSPVADYLDGPVLHFRVRLTQTPDPVIERYVLAQANVTLSRRSLRAQVTGRTAHEAVDLLRDRLQEQAIRHSRRWDANRGARPTNESHEWRHQSQPSEHPAYFPRPVEEREVIRHKSFAPHRIGADEAAWEMDQFDYDFHLFTDLDTDRDAVIFRDGPTGYRMQRLADGPEPAEPVTLSSEPAPRLTFDEARERLELADLDFVFFADAASKRGNVVYHRYDGHYGVITPA